MSCEVSEIRAVLFHSFTGEIVKLVKLVINFPYRTVLGEVVKLSGYIYRRYIPLFHRFTKGATGAGCSYSFTTYPTSPQDQIGGAR